MQIQSTDFNFEAPNESLCTFVQPFQIDSFGNRWPKLITAIKTARKFNTILIRTRNYRNEIETTRKLLNATLKHNGIYEQIKVYKIEIAS